MSLIKDEIEEVTIEETFQDDDDVKIETSKVHTEDMKIETFRVHDEEGKVEEPIRAEDKNHRQLTELLTEHHHQLEHISTALEEVFCYLQSTNSDLMAQEEEPRVGTEMEVEGQDFVNGDLKRVRGQLVCKQCGKQFKTKGNLNSHMRIHTGEEPFTCRQCGQRYPADSTKVHMGTQTGESPFSSMGKSYPWKATLQSHMKSHSVERPFMCPQCGKSFRLKEVFKTHLRIHTGEKTYICHQCGKTYSHNVDFGRHRRRFGEKPYTCSQCRKGFQV